MTRLALAFAAVLALALWSLFVGVSDVTPASLIAGGPNSQAARVLVISRVPRTLALLLAGVSMSIAGLLMQMMIRNRFVEPSTAGTVDAASLGLLLVTLIAPGTPVFGKMLVAAAFAGAGTVLFLKLLERAPLRDVVMVPLIGIMFGGVIGAATAFLAYRYDLLQMLTAWRTGDFSGVLRGRYELLWVGFAMAAIACSPPTASPSPGSGAISPPTSGSTMAACSRSGSPSSRWSRRWWWRAWG